MKTLTQIIIQIMVAAIIYSFGKYIGSNYVSGESTKFFVGYITGILALCSTFSVSVIFGKES